MSQEHFSGRRRMRREFGSRANVGIQEIRTDNPVYYQDLLLFQHANDDVQSSILCQPFQDGVHRLPGVDLAKSAAGNRQNLQADLIPQVGFVAGQVTFPFQTAENVVLVLVAIPSSSLICLLVSPPDLRAMVSRIPSARSSEFPDVGFDACGLIRLVKALAYQFFQILAAWLNLLSYGLTFGDYSWGRRFAPIPASISR